MSMKFLADNGGLQALIQAIKDQLALFDRNKQNKLIAGRGITINQSTRVISSDGEPNVQADWDMATESAASFIRNKPDIYTKREIDSMFSATITFVRVDELPATGTHGTVYLVPKQGAGTSDIYDEYLWLSASGSVEAHYELIGSTSVDLTNYYTKTQTDNLLGDKVDKESGKGLSTEDFTTAEKTKLSNIEAGAKANVQSDWNQSDNTKDDYIKNKPTIRQPSADGTAGQYLKSNGNGNAPSWETMDTVPTENSTKAVTSGGVKTALDGKQASISITNKTDDAGDNDKVIMQANGITDTTTFVRRSLSNLLNWFRSKLDEVYVPFGWIAMNEVPGMTPRLYNAKLDDVLWGADKRYDVTWKVYDGTTHEQLYDKSGYIQTLFNGTFEGKLEHPVTGEYEVLTIQPKDNDGSQTLRTYWQGTLILYFYYTHAPNEAPTCRIKQRNSNTWTTLTATKLRGSAYKINLSVSPNWYYLNTLEITIQGKTDTTEGGGTSLRGLVWIPTRYTYAESSVVTKYEQSQSLYGNVTAPKFITRGGTSSQYLRGDGSLTTLSTSPTNGSGLPITSGAVYEALNNKQNKFLTFDIPANSGYATLTLISDITESFSTPNYVGHGIVGFMYGWRAGNLSGSTAQRITCWGNHDTNYVKLQTDNNNNNALKPLLVYYNSRYYLALKKGKRSGMTHYFIGYSANILSTRINLYANSDESKWYSDSGRTTEVTFTRTKDYSRYEGAYCNFGGNTSQLVRGDGTLDSLQNICNDMLNALTTGNSTPVDADYYICQWAGGGTTTKTYHRRPMSALWNWIKTHFDTAPTANSDNPVTSGGVKTALDDYFPLAGKKAIEGVYKNAPSYIHNVDFGNTSTEGIWRKFCVISTRQTYRNAVGEIHINARSTQGTIYLTIGSSGTSPQEGENNTLSPSVKYLSLYNDYRPVYWRVNDDNELELWWKATQYYDSVGVTGVNFSPYFLSLGSDYNAGVDVQWTNVVSLEAPANLSQAQDVSLTTLDVSAGDVLTIDGDNYKDYLRTPSGGIPTSVLEADRIVLPRAYSTIFFDTNYTATISYILGATGSNVQKNGRRLTVAGNWKPREESSGDGRFTQYLYRYRGGSVGASGFVDRLREAFEDFVYFNGIWYSKGY